MNFKTGDTVRYIGRKTEYKILQAGKNLAWAELIKPDPLDPFGKGNTGKKFCLTLSKLELISHRAKHHPLTTIFKDHV